MATLPTYIYGDTANYVLNLARSRVNEIVQTPAGQPISGGDPDLQLTQQGGSALLAELNPDGSVCNRTFVIFHAAYRKFQKYLGNLGYRELIKDNLIVTINPNANADPAAQQWLSWNGFFDGTTFSNTPALPQDFIAPLKIRSRLSGENAVFVPTRPALDGLPPYVATRGVLNTLWEWRNNALYLIGASAINDLQFRYTTYLPDLVLSGSPPTPWYYQLLPIPRCASALAWYIAYEVCFPRGDEPGAAQTLAQAEGEADLVFNDQARADQRTNNRRRPRGGGSSSRNWGYRYGF